MLLCSTFMTPLEREDIEALAGQSRITKVAKKFAQRLLLFGSTFKPIFSANSLKSSIVPPVRCPKWSANCAVDFTSIAPKSKTTACSSTKARPTD